MSIKARFVSVEYITENTIIDKNIDANLINKMIDEAQDLNVQQILGYHLYKTMMRKVADGTINDSNNTAYLTLLVDFIQNSVCKWVVYHILPHLNYHLTNKAISTKSSDYSQPSGLDELAYLRDEARSKAEFYDARIREHIINNTGDYPEYWTVDGVNRITAKSQNYFGGIYLPAAAKIPNGVNISNDGFGDCTGYF